MDISKYFHFERAYIVRVTENPSKMVRDDLDVRSISIDNIQEGAWFNDTMALEKFKHFLSKNQFGYFTLLNDIVVFRTWIFSNSRFTLVGRDFKYQLAANELFSGWSLTTEKARGKGVFPYTLNQLIHLHPNKVISAYIDRNNIASLNGVKKTGFTVIRKIALITLWRLKVQIDYGDSSKRQLRRISFGSIVKSDLGYD